MARRQRQEATYLDDDLGDRLDDAADEHDMSKAKILREGLRRQLQIMEAEENAD